MKFTVTKLLTTTMALLLSLATSADARLKPFVLAATTDAAIDTVIADTRTRLVGAGFEVLGEYQPYDGAAVMMVTSADLRTAALANDTSVWGAVMRVSVTAVDDTVQTSFANPVYLATAYRMDTDLMATREKLEAALGYVEDFGSKKGLKSKSLRKYRYMLGMERVDDPYELAVFDTQTKAQDVVSRGLASESSPLRSLYQLTLDEQTTLYGVGMTGQGDDGKYHDDAFQMSVVDFNALKGTAYLPYEILVRNGKVTALHMRYRMAVHYPDLSMMGKHSFMTLRPSPDAIEDALKGMITAGQQ